MTSKISNKLVAYISSIVDNKYAGVINLETPIISSGIIDSFELIDLALFVESEFNVEIRDTELSASTFDNISQLANIISIRQNANSIE